jgi:hypothetical protein
MHDFHDFLPSKQVIRVDHSRRLGEYVFTVAPKFSRPNRGRADSELSSLRRFPLSVAEHHDVNVLIILFRCRLRICQRNRRPLEVSPAAESRLSSATEYPFHVAGSENVNPYFVFTYLMTFVGVECSEFFWAD